MHAEIWRSTHNGLRWHWHLRDSRGQIITNGASLASRSDALRDARACIRSIVKPCLGGTAAVTFNYREVNNVTEMRWS